MGYGVPSSGKDRTPSFIPDYELRERYFRPFKACIEAGALAKLLCGKENFSGKLPFTYPKYVNSLHTYGYKVNEHREEYR